MNLTRRTLVLAAMAACVTSQFAVAADPVAASKPEQAIKSAAQDGKLIYLLFYKESDAATKSMATVVGATVKSQNGRSTFSTVRLTDPVERTVAERYQLTRAPMPMVIAVHPNGAVTGYYHTQATAEQLEKCVVSPKKAECMQALQQNQLVLVYLQTQAKQPLPQGVRDLQSDPHFAKRTQVVTLVVNDPAEGEFLSSMEVDPQRAGPMTVFLAPPGAVVGKFATTATKDQLAAKLAEAGKCCDDANCKHNQQQSTQQTTKPGKVSR